MACVLLKIYHLNLELGYIQIKAIDIVGFKGVTDNEKCINSGNVQQH